MKHTSTLWYIILIITTFINLTNTINICAMELPTENEQFLHAVNTLPPEIQTTIALLVTNEFLLLAKTLEKCTTPIKVLEAKDPLVKIQLYGNKNNHHEKEETWNIYTGKLISSVTKRPYHAKVNHQTVTTVIASGYIHCNITTSNTQKQKLSSLYLNFNTQTWNTKGKFLTYLKKTLTIPQADLINRAYNTIKSNNNFTIYELSEDGKIFLTFDKDIRIYLLRCLHIKLTMYSWVTALENYIIQCDKMLLDLFWK